MRSSEQWLTLSKYCVSVSQFHHRMADCALTRVDHAAAWACPRWASEDRTLLDSGLGKLGQSGGPHTFYVLQMLDTRLKRVCIVSHQSSHYLANLPGQQLQGPCLCRPAENETDPCEFHTRLPGSRVGNCHRHIEPVQAIDFIAPFVQSRARPSPWLMEAGFPFSSEAKQTSIQSTEGCRHPKTPCTTFPKLGPWNTISGTCS